MLRPSSKLVVVAAWIVGGSLTYTAADYGQWPRIFHDQAAHRFFWARSAGTPAPAGYVGLWLWALCGGLVAAGLAWLLVRRREPSARVQQLFTAWAATACVIAAAYFAWNNRP